MQSNVLNQCPCPRGAPRQQWQPQLYLQKPGSSSETASEKSRFTPPPCCVSNVTAMPACSQPPGSRHQSARSHEDRVGIHWRDHEKHRLVPCSHPTFASGPSHFITGWFPSSRGCPADRTVLAGWVACSQHVFAFPNLTYAWLHSASRVCLAGLLGHAAELCQGQKVVGLVGAIWGTPLQPPARANIVFRDSRGHLAPIGRCRKEYCPCTVLSWN